MSQLTVPVSARDHVRGSLDAPVIMVEYADFQCPYCGQAYPVVKALENDLGDMLAVVFRHFPLATVHPHAQLAAEAAEAAGAQRRFWEMHDTLFEHQSRLAPDDLVAYASMLHLDEARFAQDLAEHRHAGKVREDFLSGVRSGVSGTPTFFINGLMHVGFDPASLLAAIRHAASLGGRTHANRPAASRGR
jgi:protein-disulfide isomerase